MHVNLIKFVVKKTVFFEDIPYLVDIWEFYSVGIYVCRIQVKTKTPFLVSLYVTLWISFLFVTLCQSITLYTTKNTYQ